MLKATVAKIKYVLQKSLICIIKIYHYAISPFLGSHCRFYPSCSNYAKTAIEQYGPFYGCWLMVRRLIKCHPWHPGGNDEVPIRKTIK